MCKGATLLGQSIGSRCEKNYDNYDDNHNDDDDDDEYAADDQYEDE